MALKSVGLLGDPGTSLRLGCGEEGRDSPSPSSNTDRKADMTACIKKNTKLGKDFVVFGKISHLPSGRPHLAGVQPGVAQEQVWEERRKFHALKIISLPPTIISHTLFPRDFQLFFFPGGEGGEKKARWSQRAV